MKSQITLKSQIDIIPSHKIDKQKWDQCIVASKNAMLYARTSYLDNMSDNWSGIVVNDYETVMPICWRMKLGIKYCYDVPFVQQLGWFAKNNFTEEDLLLQKLFSFCKYGDYNFNFSNNVSFKRNDRTNFIIHLSETHTGIQKNYTTVLNNNLQRAKKENFIYHEENIEDAITLYKNLYKNNFKHLTNKDFRNFSVVVRTLKTSGNAFARKVTNNKNILLASILLLKDELRIYNIINNVTQSGRKINANHFLYDNILKEFSETNFIFDFEGSDIPGVKKFYQGFGAINQPYFKIHFNHLPLLLRLLKS